MLPAIELTHPLHLQTLSFTVPGDEGTDTGPLGSHHIPHDPRTQQVTESATALPMPDLPTTGSNWLAKLHQRQTDEELAPSETHLRGLHQ